MRTVFVSAAGALLIASAPATASVFTLGSTFAESCYRAAEARDTSRVAQDSCDKALSEDALTLDDRVATHVNRGILSMISGDLVRANQDFEHALALDPRQPEAWLNKAIAEMKTGNGAAALEMANRSIALRTERPAIAYYIRAVANEDAGNVKAAYTDFRRARELAPNWRVPAVELARYRLSSR
jgi:tetratricopeptide (TPR) repeat protein